MLISSQPSFLFHADRRPVIDNVLSAQTLPTLLSYWSAVGQFGVRCMHTVHT